MTEAEENPLDENVIYNPPGIVHRYSRLSEKIKVILVVVVLLAGGGVALSLHLRANKNAQVQAVLDVKTQKQMLKAFPIIPPDTTGSTPLQIDLFACSQARTSISSIAKPVAQLKTLDDAINELEAISAAITEIDKYALPPLKIPLENLVVTSHLAALSLHKNAIWQQTANTALEAAISDFLTTCKALHSQG